MATSSVSSNVLVNIIILPLLTLLVVDLVLFGGGRVVEFFNITLRMVIFACCIIAIMSFYSYKKSIDTTALCFILIMMFVLIYASLISASEGELETKSVVSYFFFLLAGLFSVYPFQLVDIFRKFLPFCSVFMACSYLLFVFLLLAGKVSITDIYIVLPDSEVFLRGMDGLVYKGFVFIMVGFLYFFIVKSSSWFYYFLCFLCFFSIVATLTRGFVLSLLVTTIVYCLFNKRRSFVKYFSLSTVLIIVPLSILIFTPDFVFREGSDSTRFNDIIAFSQLLNDDYKNFLFGWGISKSLSNRASVENVYMDVLIHFGFVGLFLLFTLYVKIHLCYTFVKARVDSKEKDVIDWLYYSTFLFYLQSTFNPYINNYIGGVFVIMVFFYFSALSRKVRNVSPASYVRSSTVS